jgi:catechol 2,3-dioxygenase-like lactoylglutathione lyase family enzyme
MQPANASLQPASRTQRPASNYSVEGKGSQVPLTPVTIVGMNARKIKIGGCLALGLVAALATLFAEPVENATPYLAGIAVADVSKSKEWYEKNFGFQQYHRSDLPDYGLKIVFLKLGSYRLELIEKKGSAALSHYAPELKDEMLAYGIKKLAFAVGSVDRAAERLRANGARFIVEPFDDKPMKLRTLIVADPDGHLIQLMQELPPTDKS